MAATLRHVIERSLEVVLPPPGGIQAPAPVTVAAVEAQRLARVTLVAFALTFVFSRILVYLIMSRRLPDLYVHIGGTHVHHLNYGIFLLAGVGAYLLFSRPRDWTRLVVAAIYGIGLALTFDEFGMWLHLNDQYWQRASFDAVIAITSVLGLIVVAPRWRSLRLHHWVTAAALVAALVIFVILWHDSLRYADRRLGPWLYELQRRGPR
jgi:hypothetical protein